MFSLFAKPLFVVGVMLCTFLGVGTYAWFEGKEYCEEKVEAAKAEAYKDAAETAGQLATKTMAKIRVLDAENAKVREELRHAIHDNPVCYFTPDAILLLDEARGVPKSTSLDARTNSGTLTHLSRQGAADEWAADGKASQLCRDRVDLFIEWHRKATDD